MKQNLFEKTLGQKKSSVEMSLWWKKFAITSFVEYSRQIDYLRWPGRECRKSFHQSPKWKDVGWSERSIGGIFSSWNLNCPFATWNMFHTESSLTRLNKKDLLRMLLDYLGKFNNILDKLKSDLNQLKTKFWKLVSDLHISRNVNAKLSGKLVVLERKCHANYRYSRRECLEILGISAELGDEDIENKCWIFCMQSAPLLTWICLRTAIVYSQKFHQKSYVKTEQSQRL